MSGELVETPSSPSKIVFAPAGATQMNVANIDFDRFRLRSLMNSLAQKGEVEIEKNTEAGAHDSHFVEPGRRKAPHHGKLHGCARIRLWRNRARPGNYGSRDPCDIAS